MNPVDFLQIGIFIATVAEIGLLSIRLVDEGERAHVCLIPFRNIAAVADGLLADDIRSDIDLCALGFQHANGLAINEEEIVGLVVAHQQSFANGSSGNGW